MNQKEFDKLEPVFVQKYYEGCPTDHLFGTKEIPVYQTGWSSGFDGNGYVAWYPDWIAKNRPGCITPSFLRSERINIQIGKDVRIGVVTPIDADSGKDAEEWFTWIRIEFQG